MHCCALLTQNCSIFTMFIFVMILFYPRGIMCPLQTERGASKERLRFVAAGLKPALEARRPKAWHFPLAGKSLSKALNY